MDIISFNEASTANGRIEKVIANPDSTSGIVTVPSTIPVGETITIPAGRMAVLPNVQVDGTLNVEGEVFIPTGSAINMGNGLTINGEKIVMSVPTSYHLLQGNLAVDNTVITQGFNTTLYTGNGTTQSINTGIDMDTQWGSTAEEKFGGLVWLKGRSAVSSNHLTDSIRGATKYIFTNNTDAEATASNIITSLNNNGFSLGNYVSTNTSSATYASWNFQTTHRISGVTNHGKAYTCHYNPFTGFTIVKYEGSGIAGHEIPHHLGRKLGFATVKNLSTAQGWITGINTLKGAGYLQLNLTDAFTAQTDSIGNWFPTALNTETTICSGANNVHDNTPSNQYILYGWANSYFDESNKLIGNYEIGVYQGTGASGNKVKTRGKPAWVKIKRLDVSTDWLMVDNQRSNFDGTLFPNLTNIEVNVNNIDIVSDGFVNQSSGTGNNTSGGQYLYMVVYDTNSDGGGSYYPRATDIANVQISNALIPIAKGSDINGLKNVMLSKNESITGLTYTAGKNYIYYDGNGNKGVKAYEPRYLPSELVRRFAGEQPDYFDVVKNKWFSTDAGSELVINGNFSSGVTTGWIAQDGAVLSIDNGTLKVLNGASSAGSAYQLITGLTIGKKYKIKAQDVGGNTTYSSIFLAYTAPTLANAIYPTGGSSNGTLSTLIVDTEFIAQATSVYVVLRNEIVTVNLYNNFDNISVFPTEIVPTTEIPEGRNYLNHIVHADNDGGVLYVEELPKIVYKDVIKANEYKGKNACTAWVNFDATTTPPTIRDSYGVNGIVRISNYRFEIYHNLDNNNYAIEGGTNTTTGGAATHLVESNIPRIIGKTVVDFRVYNGTADAVSTGLTNASVTIFGGKN